MFCIIRLFIITNTTCIMEYSFTIILKSILINGLVTKNCNEIR